MRLIGGVRSVITDIGSMTIFETDLTLKISKPAFASSTRTTTTVATTIAAAIRVATATGISACITTMIMRI